MVSDGSGSEYSRACGWAAVVIERATGERELKYGAMNSGTSNVAEMMAVLQALEWVVHRVADRKRPAIQQVHVVTDSGYVRDQGSTGKGVMAGANAGLWAAFQAYPRRGLVLTWHQIGREDAALNSLADRAAKLARRLLQDYNVQEDLNAAKGVVVTQYDFNPDT